MKTLLKNLTNLNSIYKQLIMIFVDSGIVIFMLLSAFSLRMGHLISPTESLFFAIYLSPLVAIPIFFSFRLYRSVIRYIGFKSFLSIIQAISLYAVAWGLFCYMFSVNGINGIPRSVIFINWMLCIIAIGGTRIIARYIFGSLEKIENSNVLIYGVGAEGIQLSNALQLENGFTHVAYIDDIGQGDQRYINGTPVFSSDKLEYLIEKFNVSDVFIASNAISRKKKKQIYKGLKKININVRNMPSVSEIAKGKVKIDSLLDIKIRELLGRDVVEPNINLLEIKIKNKVVLVSGAGGSIGSELCRQILLLKPKKIILFEISEASLYKIESELLSLKIIDTQIIPIIGSVRDFLRTKEVLKTFSVETIYHAAAYKHVPLVEYNQAEGVLNNTFGTMYFAKAAIEMKVETFVLISTDKAVRPTNTMGASKRIAEMILQSYASQVHSTCFTMVRFGNVLDSSGSVIPLFKKQIREGGPITVTDKDIVRFFMTIPEAVELVIQAGAMGQGGDVFVLEMGEPVKIYDLALKMIELSGLQLLDKNNPDGDIEIVFTGLRPGEKLFEELLVDENVDRTENELIMRAKSVEVLWEKIEFSLLSLENACINSNQIKIRQLLTELVPDFSPQSPVIDFTFSSRDTND